MPIRSSCSRIAPFNHAHTMALRVTGLLLVDGVQFCKLAVEFE